MKQFLTHTEKPLLFLTLLFLPTQLGRHFWPTFSYIYSLKIDYFSPTIYFWDLLVFALLVVWLVGKPKVNKLALNVLLIFLLSQILSLFFAKNIGAGVTRIEQYLITGLFGVYLASKPGLSLIKAIWKPIYIGLVFESILSLIQFLKGSTVGLWFLGERTFSLSTPGIATFDFQGLQLLRPYGTFPHPNVMAAYMILSVILIYWCKPMKKILVTTIIFSFTTLLTVSRVGLVALSLVYFYLLSKRFLLVILVLMAIASPILITRFTATFNFDNLTVLRRNELDESALGFISGKPFLGIGLNNFIVSSSEQLIAGPNRFLQPVHNIYLLALSETGIVGLLGFILLIGIAIYKSLKQNLLILCWFVILFLGVFDHYFLTLPQGYRLLFLVWGLSLARNTKLLDPGSSPG